MKIAIIGSGVSGLVCAHVLGKSHDVTIYEAADYVGGHTNTHDIELAGKTYAVDTGFIVCNDRTYPNFLQLMAELDIEFQPSVMGFSVTDELENIEYNTMSTDTFFAQRTNLLRPKFYYFIREIFRFNKITNAMLVDDQETLKTQTLDEFLAEHRFSDRFARWYILPMIAAVWSSSFETAGKYPMLALLRFLGHHGLLATSGQPMWKVVKGGSREYVRALLARFTGEVRLNAPVINVADTATGVNVTAGNAGGDTTEEFDRVIFACHSDQALRMLDKPDQAEKTVLGGIKYQHNETVLHTDTSLLPKRKKAWTAWNYRLPKNDPAATSLTYNMNILQSLDAPETLCVTLNQTKQIDQSKVIKVLQYEHPVYTHETVESQERWADISSHERRKFYCGAYWFNGFHEDGVKSALRVCEAFGMSL